MFPRRLSVSEEKTEKLDWIEQWFRVEIRWRFVEEQLQVEKLFRRDTLMNCNSQSTEGQRAKTLSTVLS